MRDLIVRQPHLGRESTVLLGRIVDSRDDGLAQDDIEPYLLVRLLRCGYIRRQQSRGSNFVATPAGIERSRFEAIVVQRRQDDLDRREIIRGRLHTMVARLELDYPDAPPPSTLRDFGLPQISQRERPALYAPELPAVHVAGLRAARDARRRIAGPEPLAVARDAEQRMTPEAALSLIREGEQREQRESQLPVTIAGELLPPEADLPVEHVGRLPAKRGGGVPAMREDAVPVVFEDAVPVVREDSVPVVRDDAMPAILLEALVGGPLETLQVSDEDALHDDAPQSKMAEPGGSGWRRAAVVATVATVALLAAHPAYRYLSAPVGEPPTGPVAPASVPTAAPLLATNATASNAAAAIPDAMSIHEVADRMPPAPIGTDKPVQATVRLPESGSVVAAAPTVIASAPTVRAPEPGVAASASAVTTPAPAEVSATSAAVVGATSRSPRAVTPKPDSDASRNAPDPEAVAARHEPDRVVAAQTSASGGRSDSEKSLPRTTPVAGTRAATSSSVSVAPAIRATAEPRQIVATNVVPTPVVRTLVASAADASSAPMTAPPVVAARPVAASSATPATPPAPAPASPAAATPPAPATTSSAAATPRPMIATPVVAAPPVNEGPASVAAPQAAVLTAAASVPASAAPAAATTSSALPTAMATAPVAASIAATTAASAAASTVAAPAVAALPPKAAAAPVAMTRPVVTPPPVEPSSPIETTAKVDASPKVVTNQVPMVAAPEPARVFRHRPEHAVVAATTKGTLVFASATVIERPLPPLVRREAHAAPQEDPTEHVLARLRSAEAAGDPAVDRLNVLSLQAALHGKTFTPRAMSASLSSSPRTVTSPEPAWPLLP